jgi:hypothetical protein
MRKRLLVLPLVLSLAACATVREHSPWRGKQAPAPTPVAELLLEIPPDAQVPIVLQFRERNTLVVDLTGVAAAGTVGLRPGASGRWPARIALRFQPGRFEAVEARGAQRIVLPVTGDRSGPVTVELSPTVYPAPGAPLQLRWGAKSDF